MKGNLGEFRGGNGTLGQGKGKGRGLTNFWRGGKGNRIFNNWKD